MSSASYDVIAVGGGIGGACLGLALARRGLRVLIVEREASFRDRVRGEAVLPWGVVEAQELGVHELVASACGHEVGYWTQYSSGKRLAVRDFHATTPRGTGCLDFFHPDMQETLLCAAGDAGAEVRRGCRASGLRGGELPRLTVEDGRGARELRARLVVGADGRGSRVRRWAGFEVEHDPERLLVSGLLLDATGVPQDSVHVCRFPGSGRGALLFPLGRGRTRVYLVQRKGPTASTFNGVSRVEPFVRACLDCGAPEEWLADARPAGPLATFEGAGTWAPHPYRSGVALVGDAAATSDPSWGLGLSTALRDVRVLTELLTRSEDWPGAAHAYAEDHDRCHGVLHTIEGWLTDLVYEVGSEADARRARAIPLLAEDPSRIPDAIGLGPDARCDELARQRLFGEL